MRQPGGYAVINDPDLGSPQEFDTFTCAHSHCRGSVQMTKNRMGRLEVMVFRMDGTFYLKEAGFCRSCFKPICPRCDGKPCSNRFKVLEEQEKRFICDSGSSS